MVKQEVENKYIGHGANIDKMYRVHLLGDKIYGKVIKALHKYADDVIANPDEITSFIDRDAWLTCAKHTKTLSEKDFDGLFEAMLYGAGAGALFQVFIVSYMDTMFRDNISPTIKGFGKGEVEKIKAALRGS